VCVCGVDGRNFFFPQGAPQWGEGKKQKTGPKIEKQVETTQPQGRPRKNNMWW